MIGVQLGADAGIDRGGLQTLERFLVGLLDRDGAGDERCALHRVVVAAAPAAFSELHRLELRARVVRRRGGRAMSGRRLLGGRRRGGLRLRACSDGGKLHFQLLDAALLRRDLPRLRRDLSLQLEQLDVLAHLRAGARGARSEGEDRLPKPQGIPPVSRRICSA